MPEFIFMLTRSDLTIADALAVYDKEVRATRLQYVGFKDVGQPIGTLRDLTRHIQEDGRTAVLEIVSEDETSEVASVRTGLDLGVDLIMGGTHHEAVRPLLAGHSVRYLPFPGNVVGHPSILQGPAESIVTSAVSLAQLPGVHGLDLLAYRFKGDVPGLISSVVGSVDIPVVVAGSIDSIERTVEVCKLGAWGFTIGSAIVDGSFLPGCTTREAIERVLDRVTALGEPQATPVTVEL